MADSASDPKVEDVLSSVRRLVSGEIPRNARPAVPNGPGALVLTEADRIQKDPTSRVARSLEERIAELEAAVDNGDEEFEPDGSEDQAQNVPDRIVYTRPPSSEEEAEMRRSTLRLSEIALIPTGPAVDENTPADTISAVPFRHDNAKFSRLGHNGGPPAENADVKVTTQPPANIDDPAPMAVDVPTEPPRRADVTAFTNPDDVVERIEARIDNGEEHVPEAPIAVASAPDAADTTSDSLENMLREDVVDPTEAPSVDDFDKALNAAVEASVSSVVFKELAEVGIVEKEPDPEPESEQIDRNQPDVEAKAEGDSPEAVSAPVALPDQDALRQMVSSLMREELQGELGERITRNVRKLVRREIKRALDANDLI